jgi:transposase
VQWQCLKVHQSAIPHPLRSVRLSHGMAWRHAAVCAWAEKLRSYPPVDNYSTIVSILKPKHIAP